MWLLRQLTKNQTTSKNLWLSRSLRFLCDSNLFLCSCSNFTFLCQPYRINLTPSRWRSQEPHFDGVALRSMSETAICQWRIESNPKQLMQDFTRWATSLRMSHQTSSVTPVIRSLDTIQISMVSSCRTNHSDHTACLNWSFCLSVTGYSISTQEAQCLNGKYSIICGKYFDTNRIRFRVGLWKSDCKAFLI